MTFGEAVEALKKGEKVTREVWQGYWILMDAPQVAQPDEEGYVISKKLNPTIFAVLKDNGGVTVAAPYQSDILAEDWKIVK